MTASRLRPVEEFAILEAPERAVTRHGKGRPMKALLTKKWGTNYAGQVLTGVEKGSIPDSVAQYYEDDEPSPMDVVKEDEDLAGNNPLAVANDELDSEKAQKIADQKKETVKLAKEAKDPASLALQAQAEEESDSQRRAREADEFAAKRLGKSGVAASKSGAAKPGKKPGKKPTSAKDKKRTAGKEHGVK